MIGDNKKESLLNKDTGSTANPERWVDEHGDCLYRYALLVVRNPAVAQDLVQDTLLAALRTRENFAGRSSERTWLYGILKNKTVDHFRKLGRETSFTDMEFIANEFSERFIDGIWIHQIAPTAWKPDAEDVTHRAEFWAVMKACLDKLPERIATVFLLREMEGISTKEICKSLSISERNLGVMLHRARMALRESLEINWFKKNRK